MSKNFSTAKNLLVSVLIVLVILAIFWIMRPKGGEVLSPTATSMIEAPDAPYKNYSSLSEKYRNTKYRFSFSYPKTFAIREYSSEGSEYIMVEEKTLKTGIQIVISPFDERLTALTAERIRRDIPDMVVNDPQEVELGEGGKGVAFVSDNEAFGGTSREVWFVMGDRLYQVSTYMKYDMLLQEVLGTWEFN